jgi:Subtilase family
MKRWLAGVAVGFAFAGNPASAQTGKDGRMAKVTHSLAALHEQYIAQMAQSSAVSFRTNDPLVRVVNDRVVVDAIASVDVEALKSDLMFLGMDDAVAFGGIVSGHLPIWAIPAAAALASLQFAHPAVAIANVGLVTSQGDQAMRSDVARTKFGVNGSGVNVGVLSDSFNCLGGAATDVANNDLLPVTVIQEISDCSDGADEGRAMLQIVHDIAPGANLLFATADGGQANFATNIQALAAAGAKVIVDDIIYLAEPMFQDGIIAQAVNSVASSGTAYFSAAGNQAQKSYQSAFRSGGFFAPGAFASAPGAPAFLGGIAHNFNPSGGMDQFQRITISPGSTFILSLQWDSPFFSVSGPPGSENDLDLYILDASATQVLAGTTFNNIGGDAVELFGYTNNGPTALTVNLMIVNHSGPNPTLIKYVYFGTGFIISEFATSSGTIFGHSNAAGAEAVGAAVYFNTPAFGASQPVLELFSSSGTTPVLFDSAGNRLPTPDPRADKPGLVAPDGVATTVPGFSNFFGTSAAAPHAAGVAALLLQNKPTLTPGKLYRSLENTALDMGPTGFDNSSGYGLIQADAALAASPIKAFMDFDGDGKSDQAVYRDGVWWILRSLIAGGIGVTWGGAPQDVPVPGDYDGDGKTDQAVYRDGVWWILRSSNGSGVGITWGGAPQDVPVPGDYDGDGKTDQAVYRDGVWWILRSSNGGGIGVTWGGAPQDIPLK